MMRLWISAVLGLALTVCSIGCSQGGGSAIYASAPDSGNFGMNNAMRDSGRVTLYRVTKWDNGQPDRNGTESVASYNLRPGEKVGFNWVTDPAKMYDPDAHLNLEAYAGPHRVNLGPLESRKEKYYWADPNGWKGYWAGEPERKVTQAVMMQ